MIRSNSPHPVSVTSNGGFSITRWYFEREEKSQRWNDEEEEEEGGVSGHAKQEEEQGRLGSTSGWIVVGVVQFECDLADKI